MERTAASQILFLVCWVILVQSGSSADCSVNVNSGDFPSPQPLLLKVGDDRDSSSFAAPDAAGNVTVAAGSKLVVACPGAGFKLKTLGGAQSVQAQCVGGSVFSVAGTPYTLNVLACQQLPAASVLNTTEACGTSSSHRKVHIGFTVGTDFYKLYEVCFDAAELTPLYTNATVLSGIRGFQVFPRRDRWETGGLYGSVDVTNQYRTQRDTLADLLGRLPANLSDNFLSRGHLAAKADFGLGVQQWATFHYANSAPQWSAFNGGNWNQLELDVRRFAGDNAFDLQVYTGVHDKLKLANKDGNLTEVYLYVSPTEKKVPVPLFFWKIVYEPRDQRAMVFVGVNDPYHSSLPAEYRLCTDVCSRVKWLNWKPTNQTAGLAYCCEYDDFKTKVANAPFLVVKSSFLSSGADATTSTLVVVTVFSSVSLLLRQSCN